MTTLLQLLKSRTVLFEFIPLALAMVAVVGLAYVLRNPRRMVDQCVLGVALFSSLLLIIAQSNWIQSVIAGLDTGSPFVEYVWTLFNTSVMFNCLLLVWSHLPRQK